MRQRTVDQVNIKHLMLGYNGGNVNYPKPGGSSPFVMK